jgi:VanZ family protein
MRLLKLWLPVVLWAAVILSAANDQFSAEHTQGWFERLFGRELPYAAHVAVRKMAHLLEYGILGALAWRADRRAFVAIAIAVLVAIADESIQASTVTRTGSPWDVALDGVGATLAVFAARRL